MRDMRRLPPRNSRGEFRRRRSRRDRGMDYDYYDMTTGVGSDMRDYAMRTGDYARYENDMARGRRMNRSRSRGNDYADYDMRSGRDYESDMRRGGYDRNMNPADGHHYPQGQGSTYYPIQAMGTFEGYYGMPEQDYARGDMRYDMRGGRMDYGYNVGSMYRDYGYDYGDYGETLTEEELDKWCKKLKGQLDEREKQMFSKEAISQKAKQMQLQMKDFGEKELEVATLMAYTDYKKTIGQNVDMAVRLAYDWLTDDDVAVKGAEKLAVYYDCIVEGENE